MAQFIDIAIDKANEEHDQKVASAVQALRDMDGYDKFARSDAGLLLTSDGCMSRNYRPRIEEMNENREELFNGVGEWLKEQRMWAFAYDILRTKGLRPTTDDLEEFVKVHLELEEV
jgi:hypothetical protein